MTKAAIKKILKKLTPRKSCVHKGDFGHVFVLAGSVGLTGAAALTCQAAMRSGAGLVTLGIPESLNPILEVKLTEVMTLPLNETQEKTLSLSAYHKIEQFSCKSDLIAIGPGLSCYRETSELVHRIVEKIDKPMVLDADALNAFSDFDNLKYLDNHKNELIVTPHIGEMARLLHVDIKEVKKNKQKIAKDFAKKYGVITVLKDYKTIVASPKGEVYVNMTGNPGMATAGVGDVLTGIITALWAQGLSAYEAAVLGVYMHGQAGDLAVKEKGEMSLIASDIIKAVKGSG